MVMFTIKIENIRGKVDSRRKSIRKKIGYVEVPVEFSHTTIVMDLFLYVSEIIQRNTG